MSPTLLKNKSNKMRVRLSPCLRPIGVWISGNILLLVFGICITLFTIFMIAFNKNLPEKPLYFS